jgi:hypothetical protein
MTPEKRKCTSRPDCPRDFCTGLRVKAFCYRRDREMDAERAEETFAALDERIALLAPFDELHRASNG